ncbi:nucleotidyl transferase AbiEii/AbiGii toxin family protein, partial [Microgenomates group bacterium]|nr:nucleotidyl transferase AbiEii/AbiGii toxin family protein [Microgenomates group bacterium]
MLTEDQIDELSQVFKIDRFSVFREYLQLVFLNELYLLKESVEIFFKGGTAIHLILNSPRFSEDLDFSTLLRKKVIAQTISRAVRKIQTQIPEATLEQLYETGKSIRFKLKYQTALFKYPFRIKIDFQTREKPVFIEKTPLATQFPVPFFPIISRLSDQEILAEKIAALLTRLKGRDFFDLWFLLIKKIKIDERLIKKKLAENNKKF